MEYNKAKLAEVLEAFYRTTNARVAIYDDKFNEVECFPKEKCKLCEILRQDEKIDLMCKDSDKRAFKKVQQEKERYVYQCKMGMYESVAPIISHGKLIGYIMMGQVLTLSGKNVIREKIKNFQVDILSIEKILEKSQTIPTDKLSSIGFLMSMCVEYLCAYGEIDEKPQGKVQAIEEYIKSNLTKKITVAEIADKFNMSRTALYKMYMKTYRKSPSEHINELKIEIAKQCIAQDLSTAEICEKTGIEDKNYLSRLFKRHTQMTMSEYKFMTKKGN